MRSARTLLLLLPSLAASLLGACESARDRDTLIVNIATEPPSLDWSLATDHVSFNVIANLMVGLARFDENAEPVPELAGSWEIQNDGRRYVFRLRKNALWTDGKPVTADDFVFSWRRILDPATASEYAYLLFPVLNARKVNQGLVEPEVLGVSAPDPYTLIVELEEPTAFFLSLVTFEITFPQRRDVIERHGEQWTEPANIVTNGPFRLVEWKHENRIVLEANVNFEPAPPPVDRVEMLMINDRVTAMTLFDRGRLDIMDNYSLDPLDIPSYAEFGSFERVPQLRGYYYGFNTKKPPFNDPRVRQAFSLAIRRDTFPKILLGGEQPAASWIPPGMFAHNPEIGLHHDPERARALLAEAGYPGGEGFPPVSAVFNTSERHELVAQILQAQWRETLNVEVSIENVEWKVFLAMLNEDPPPLFRLGWGADYPDPDNFMNLFTSYSGNNKTGWGSERYDALVAEAARTLDRKERRKLYDEAQRLLLEDAAAIAPLFTTAENTVTQPWVMNFHLDSMARLKVDEVRLIQEKMSR